MNARRAVRRLAKGAGIAFLAGTLGGAALLAAEIVAARSRTYAKPDLGLTVRGMASEKGGAPLRLMLLGDALALGVGVDTAEQTLGGQLIRMLSDAGANVTLSSVAVAGARSADLATQVARAQLGTKPDVAVILVGTNDATHLVRPGEAAAHLATAVRRLRDGGTSVVVGTCPDLGTVRPIAQPLRWVTRRWSRRLAAAQTVAVVAEGGRTVAFADLLGPHFENFPGEMFGPDRYHPSARGYLHAAYAVLPSVCAALGLWPEPEPGRGDGSQPIHLAAAIAAEESGTEVTATRVDGRTAGPRGRWARLLRRGGPPVEHTRVR